uniref:P-type ATPase N-terminal domain-containing protein n=1 Tax=Equus asinus TaxID=9793 RepID=A0A9L0IS52_EQUAS
AGEAGLHLHCCVMFLCLLAAGPVHFSLGFLKVEEKMGWQQAVQESDGSKVRTIYLNEPLKNNFCKNSISTAKYSLWSFLPQYLYLQFSKAANAFFLFITIFQEPPYCFQL